MMDATVMDSRACAAVAVDDNKQEARCRRSRTALEARATYKKGWPL
jgi:hypothetical protein